jgi:hypothetical protein
LFLNLKSDKNEKIAELMEATGQDKLWWHCCRELLEQMNYDVDAALAWWGNTKMPSDPSVGAATGDGGNAGQEAMLEDTGVTRRSAQGRVPESFAAMHGADAAARYRDLKKDSDTD